ncbi:MAG: hypothetical protein LYZ70_05650 [Nitrososphaerales archaeon]|nr:hypothetical protein [Nitrososphaerales archaeon]
MRFAIVAASLTLIVMGIIGFLLVSGASLGAGTSGCDASESSNETNYIVNGGFEDGVQGWTSLNGANRTMLITTDGPQCGRRALELVTVQSADSEPVALRQVVTRVHQCTDDIGQTFGLALKDGLKLSFWYRTPNATETRFGVSVTFHNGTSKIGIDYILAFKGTPEASAVSPSLSTGGIETVLNSSTAQWKQATIDLYGDFVKYFGVNPISRHYCVVAIAVWQQPLGCTDCGIAPVPYKPGTSSYAFVDNFELRFAR